MRITLVYATYSNSTFMACEHAAAELNKRGYTAHLSLARETVAATLSNVEAVIFASPSWDREAEQGMPHEDFDILADHLKETTFPTLPYALMGLGDSSYTFFCGAVNHLQKMATQLQMKQMVEPLKIDNYYLNEAIAQEEISKWIADIDSYLQLQGKKDAK